MTYSEECEAAASRAGYYAARELGLSADTQEGQAMVAVVEHDNRHKLNLLDDGTIQCSGGTLEPDWVKALNHPPVTLAVRQFLAQRQSTAVVVPDPNAPAA